jgi:long-chain fatty acid transport protein
VVFALVSGQPRSAEANTEPSLYDAKSVGLGGTGIGWIQGPASLYINPAGLQGINRFSGTFSFAAIIADLSAPVGGPDDVLHTGFTPFPSALIGAGYRIHDRVVIGAGGYAQTGFGATYEGVDRISGHDLFFPEDQSVLFYVIEAALAVSVRVHDKLDVGVSFRFPYAKLDASVTQEIFPDDYRLVDQVVSGTQNVPGILAGATFRVNDDLTLAAVYRSKITIPMEGTSGIHFTQAGPTEVDTTTEWTVPHMFRLGGALELSNDKYMVAAELRAQLHKKANKAQIFRTEFPGFEEVVAPYDWKNVYGWVLGLEYRRDGKNKWPIRVGSSGSNSATPRKSTQFFTPAPGLLLAFYGGTGIVLGKNRLDFGVSYQFGSDDVPNQPGRCEDGQRVKVGCEGAYGVRSIFLTASVTANR